MTSCRLLLVALALAGCGAKPPRPDVTVAPPRPGRVTIRTQPAGAAVLRTVDDRLGNTPVTLERPGGTRLELQLIKDGYQPRQLTASFEAGRHLELELELRPRLAELIVTSGAVMGAHIFVDGEPQGRTPNRVGVVAGVEHRVEVRREGMEPYEEKVTLKAGEHKQMVAILLPRGRKAAIGVLELKVDGPAQVFLDGKPVGRTPLPPMPLPARAHEVKVKGVLGGEVKRRVLIKKGERLELRIDLSKKP